MSELGLTLRLGRAAVIQEYDVDAPLPDLSTDPRKAVWDMSLHAFSRFSTIQSKIYRKIYSPGAMAALAADPSKKRRRVAKFAAELSHWLEDWDKIDSTRAYFSMVYQHTFMAIEVIYYSVLTVLHRGSTSSESVSDISAECFAAARQGLESHLRIFPAVAARGPGTVSYYGVWYAIPPALYGPHISPGYWLTFSRIFMYSSFTPYIVTFLHCIGNNNTNDLELLKSVLDTIGEIGAGYELVQRQKTLCGALYRIAKAFIETRQKQNGTNGDAADGHSHVPMDHQAFVSVAAQTLNLPLQPDSIQDWGDFDTIVEDWESQYFGQQPLMLSDTLEQ